TAISGRALPRTVVGRGVPAGDKDADGAPDLRVTERRGPGWLMPNEGPGGPRVGGERQSRAAGPWGGAWPAFRLVAEEGPRRGGAEIFRMPRPPPLGARLQQAEVVRTPARSGDRLLTRCPSSASYRSAPQRQDQSPPPAKMLAGGNAPVSAGSLPARSITQPW